MIIFSNCAERSEGSTLTQGSGLSAPTRPQYDTLGFSRWASWWKAREKIARLPFSTPKAANADLPIISEARGSVAFPIGFGSYLYLLDQADKWHVADPNYAKFNKWVTPPKFAVVAAYEIGTRGAKRLWSVHLVDSQRRSNPGRLDGPLFSMLKKEGYVPLRDSGYRSARKDRRICSAVALYSCELISDLVVVEVVGQGGRVLVEQNAHTQSRGGLCLPVCQREEQMLSRRRVSNHRVRSAPLRKALKAG